MAINKSLKLIKINYPCTDNIIKLSVILLLKLNIVILSVFYFGLKKNTK